MFRFLFVFLVITLLISPIALAENDLEYEELQELIQTKNSELEQLQTQREALEKKVEKLGTASDELNKELKRINYNIDQLNISIRSNYLAIEKLDYEVQTLDQDVTSTETGIKQTKAGIAKLLVELQQKDDESLIFVLLKHSSLANSVSEIQSILDLSSSLSSNVNQLRELKNRLGKKINQVEDKKYQKQIEHGTLLARQDLIKEQKNEKEDLLFKTKNEQEEYQEKIEELDRRQQEISDTIEGIEDRLRESFDKDLLPVKRPGVLAWPLQDILITQCYGKTSFAAQAYRTGFHIGTDFRSALGTPILASAPGRVSVTDNNDTGTSRWQKFQFGKYIIIEHDNNLSTLYAHLSKFAVSEGDPVDTGDVIGYSGNTGYATGPHLHLGVYATPITGWNKSSLEDRARKNGGLIKIAPAAGWVPVGVHINPENYLPRGSNIGNCK